MKKLLLVAALIAALTSCNIIQDNYIKSSIEKDYLNDRYIFHSYSNDNIKNVANTCIFNLKYKYDVSPEDEWTSIAYALDTNSGDCEEFSKLFVNVMYLEYGIKCNVVLVDVGRSIVNGGIVNHAIVEMPNGTLVEPQGGFIQNYTVGYRYTFDELFYSEIK